MAAPWLGAGAGLALALTPFAALASMLEVRDAQGAALLSWPMAEGERWCLHWNHSVAGFLVRDCFATIDGRMMLERSHQPDFAAGLGHIPGRGEMLSAAEGGYWIEAINEFIPHNCLPLRVGAGAVNHRLVSDDREQSLTEIAEGQSVRLVLHAPGAEGENPC